MYKLVAIDLDGTLLNTYGEITEHTKEVLAKVQEKGTIVMIASGRPIDSIKTIAKEINSNEYFIASNGALIYDIQKEQTIYENNIPYQKVLEIAKICQENNIFYNVYTEKTIVAKELKHNVLYYNKDNQKKAPNKRTNITLVSNILEYIIQNPEEKCLKIMICDESETIFKSVIRKLRTVQNVDILDVSHMSRKTIKQGTEEVNIEYFYTEITSEKANKWYAIEKLIEKIGIKPEEVIAIGDNMNDKLMIEQAGIGVCMGQATPIVKEIADIIAENNNDEGVAKALEKIFSIQ